MAINKEVAARLVMYTKKAAQSFQFGLELRDSFESIDREYARTNNRGEAHMQARTANAMGDKSKIQDPTVPVIYPQVEAAHTYLSGVFLSGYPIFGVTASPENADAADMMDAYNTENSMKAGWSRNISLSMREGLKYNIMALEVAWETKTTYALQKQTTGKLAAKPVVWQGNVLRYLPMYNVFWDTRVAPAEVHCEGEFAGYHCIKSRTRLKQFMQDLPEEFRMNGKEAFEVGTGDQNYYVPQITNKLNHDPRKVEFDWMAWATDVGQSQQRIKYQNTYEVTVLYARIVPEDFRLDVPAKSTPQIWKLIIVNSQILIYAERLTNAHNYLPIIFGSPTEDGLAYQGLSFAENQLEIQDMATSLWTARMAAARRNISDRIFYNPQVIKQDDINSNSPSAKIPVRPGAYGSDIRAAVLPVPYSDQSASSLVRDAMQVVEFGRSLSGINRGQEGQFTKGNRTLEEFDRTMQNSDARLQTMALFLECQFFTPIKEIIKYNVLQYAQPGDVYYPVKSSSVAIDPNAMQNAAMDFKISDGLLPASKLVDADFLQVLMQLIMSSPEMMQQFDIVRLVSYLASMRNVPGLDAFRRQAQPGQQVSPAAQQPAGAVSQPNPTPQGVPNGQPVQ